MASANDAAMMKGYDVAIFSPRRLESKMAPHLKLLPMCRRFEDRKKEKKKKKMSKEAGSVAARGRHCL